MPERGWALALRDMLDACERCLDYTAGMDQTAFVEDRRTYDATIRNIEIVGEAANNVHTLPLRRRGDQQAIDLHDLGDDRPGLLGEARAAYAAIDPARILPRRLVQRLPNRDREDA